MDALPRLISLLRPEVRSARPYRVFIPPGIETKLNQNESPYDVPIEQKRAILDQVLEIPLNRYPSDQPERLTQAIADHLEYDPDGILVGNGSNDLCHTLGLSLISPGSAVVLPRPMFALFESVARIYGSGLTTVPPREDLSFDTDGLVAAIRDVKPVLTVVATPNNPTGLEMAFADLAALADTTDGFLLIDQAYEQFAQYRDAMALLDRYPNVLLMRTFSKALGLAGLRIGYLVGHPSIIEELLKARLPFMIDEISQRFAIALLKEEELIQDRVESMLASSRELQGRVQEIDEAEVVPTHANFFLFRTALPAAELVRRLSSRGVLVRDVSGYEHLDRFVRVSAGTPAENKAFLTALKGALDEGPVFLDRERGST